MDTLLYVYEESTSAMYHQEYSGNYLEYYFAMIYTTIDRL